MLLRNDTWVPYDPTKTIGEYRNKSCQPNIEQAQRGAPRCSHGTFPLGKFLKALKTSFKKFSSRVRGGAPRS